MYVFISFWGGGCKYNTFYASLRIIGRLYVLFLLVLGVLLPLSLLTIVA